MENGGSFWSSPSPLTTALKGHAPASASQAPAKRDAPIPRVPNAPNPRMCGWGQTEAPPAKSQGVVCEDRGWQLHHRCTHACPCASGCTFLSCARMSTCCQSQAVMFLQAYLQMDEDLQHILEPSKPLTEMWPSPVCHLCPFTCHLQLSSSSSDQTRTFSHKRAEASISVTLGKALLERPPWQEDWTFHSFHNASNIDALCNVFKCGTIGGGQVKQYFNALCTRIWIYWQ